MDQPALSDPERLALDLRSGRDVLGAWYEATFPLTQRLCRGFLASGGPEADDVAQEAMLRLVDEIDRWNPTGPFGAWQRTVVLNMCRNYQRASKRRATHEDAAGRERTLTPAPDPSDALAREEARALLEECLEMLPAREREAFVLVDLDGMAPAEAADIMGVAGSTARAALSMARRRLRDALAPRLQPGFSGGDAS